MPLFFWWGKLDSDQRSRRQQIYSLPPLAAREFPHMVCFVDTCKVYQKERLLSTGLGEKGGFLFLVREKDILKPYATTKQ